MNHIKLSNTSWLCNHSFICWYSRIFQTEMSMWSVGRENIE